MAGHARLRAARIGTVHARTTPAHYTRYRMKKTILLADGDDAVRGTLARVLELEQYEVVLAACGSQAAEKLLNCLPALALCDLELPGDADGPGLDALCEVAPGVPLVLITARSHQYNRARQLGASALMEKPLHLPLLLRTIRNLVSEPRNEWLRRLTEPGFKTLFLHHSAPSRLGAV